MDSLRLRIFGFTLLPIWLLASATHADVRQGVELVTIATPEPSRETQLYIVQFAEPPALALSTDAGASAATLAKPAALAREARKLRKPRQRFKADSPRVQSHVRKLKNRQDAMLRKVGAEGEQVYDYQYTFNGVAVRLTESQARKLRSKRGVKAIWADSKRKVITNNSPAFLGLFNGNGGLRSDLGLSGEDVIVGVIDSGVTPNHPSLSDRDQSDQRPKICRGTWGETSLLGLWLCARFKDRVGAVVFSEPPDDWNGVCQTGEAFPASACNNKLIGARFYREGFDASGPVDENEFDSPADADGHGTHIASIAAGNVVEANIFGREIGDIGGMAPRARVAVYKACWLEPGGFRAVCSVADLQKAIEDAVADGVDVINYSIGALRDSLNEPDDLALLAAAEAGIPSAVAAGNNGPDDKTILSPATTPWVIAVGATSRAGNRVAEAVEIDAPDSLAGLYESREASFTPELDDVGPYNASLVLVDDGMAMTPEGASGTTLDACSELQNSSELTSNIAFIQRGGCDFELKIANAEAAGAIAAVVFSNDQPLSVMAGTRNSVNIPAVMIGQADGQLIRDQLADDIEVVLTLDKDIFATIIEDEDVLGAFSARGPNLADPDFLKPDLVAPGVNILGGHTSVVANGFRGELYQYLSGTSQSAPHVAGIAALLREAHPDWSASAIKSALMTSTRQDIVRENGTTQADPFDMGAGHIVPNNAVDPGLLYEVETQEYDGYLCKAGLGRVGINCADLEAAGLYLDAKELNLPSIAITELVASETITRRVRNPGEPNQFEVTVDAPEGLTVTVEPEVLTLGTDEVAEFTITFVPDRSNVNEYLYGGIRWESETQRVYSPFVVLPRELGFALEASGTGSSGSAAVPLRFGYDGAYQASVAGLELACTLPDLQLGDAGCEYRPNNRAEIARDPNKNYEFLATPPPWVTRFVFETDPTDDLFLRVQLKDELTDGFDAATGVSADDLDLYLYHCPNGCTFNENPIGFSFGEGSNELIDIDASLDPLQAQPTGTFVLDVHAFDTEDQANGTRFAALVWALGSQDAGNLTLSNVPGAATSGTQTSLSADWVLPADAGDWLGAIQHSGSSDTEDDINFGFTVIAVEVGEATP